jgi:hypothetical protein
MVDDSACVLSAAGASQNRHDGAAPGKEALEVTFDHFSIGHLNLPPQED